MENRRLKITNTGSTRTWFLLALLCVGGLTVMLFNTTPDRLGPVGITAFFLLLAGTIFCLLMWLRARIFKQPTSTSLLAVILISVLGTGAVALNTIDIQAGEIFLLVVFGAMVSLYWVKIR